MISHLKIMFLLNKRVTIVSVITLAIATSIFAVAMSVALSELGYDKQWEDSDSVVRLIGNQTASGNIALSTSIAPFGVSTKLRDYFKGAVIASTQYNRQAASLKIGPSDLSYEEQILFVDDGYSTFFNLQPVRGDFDDVYTSPFNLAITTQLAEKLFGSLDVLDEVLYASIGSATQYQAFVIKAVFTPPTGKSIVPFGAFAKIYPQVVGAEPESLVWPGTRTYFTSQLYRLAEGENLEVINNQLKQFVESTGTGLSNAFDFDLQQLSDARIHPIGREKGADLYEIAVFVSFGAIALAASIVNLFVFRLAGIRKYRTDLYKRVVAGYEGTAFYRDVMLYSAIISALLLFLTARIVQVSYSRVEGLLQIDIERSYLMTDNPLFMLGLFCTFWAIHCAIFGPVKFSKPANALIAKPPSRNFWGNPKHISLFAQLFSTLLVAYVISGMELQLNHARGADLGFNALNTYSIALPKEASKENHQSMMQEIRAKLGQSSVTYSSKMPDGRGLSYAQTVAKSNLDNDSPITFEAISIEYDFFDVFDMGILAGRGFDESRDDYRSGVLLGGNETKKVILNEAGVRQLGFESYDDSIGKQVFLVLSAGPKNYYFPLEIVGVVQDSLYANVKSKPGPQLYSLNFPEFAFIQFKAQPGDATMTIERIQSVIKSRYAYDDAEALNISDAINSSYLEAENITKLLEIILLFCVLLSAFGLTAVLHYESATREKEFAIRKVFGGSDVEIMATFFKKYLSIITFSLLIAMPTAVQLIFRWIQSFPNQINATYLLGAYASESLIIILLSILFALVMFKRSLGDRPRRYLRHE